jgi:hypothetical protein
MHARFVALAALALCIGSGSLAAAQQAAPAPNPTPISLPTLPPSATPLEKQAIDALTGLVRTQIHNINNTSNGPVTYFKRFEMQVQTSAGTFQNIHLHQGTVINPRGESIRVGQQVSVGGDRQSDGSLNANVITIQQ